jgi:hypothetical protein
MMALLPTIYQRMKFHLALFIADYLKHAIDNTNMKMHAGVETRAKEMNESEGCQLQPFAIDCRSPKAKHEVANPNYQTFAGSVLRLCFGQKI